MKKVYSYSKDFGRMGEISGIIALTDNQRDFLQGRDVFLGEILGKHSQVSLTVNLTMVSEDPLVVDFTEKYTSHHFDFDCILEHVWDETYQTSFDEHEDEDRAREDAGKMDARLRALLWTKNE